MPTPVAHALAGIATYLASHTRRDVWLFLATVMAACFADLDFGLNFLTGDNYHHYFTHSFVFATFFSIAAYAVARLTGRPSPGRDAAIMGLAYLTHLGLDLFSKDTTPPFGMELWWPFSKEFAIAPFTVFDDIWRGTLARLLGLHNWIAVLREMLIVGPVVLGLWWWRRQSE